MPPRPTTTAAAAWSWVEKMLQLAQRTSAPSSASVSMSTAVWMVMCSEPVMRWPASGFFARVLRAHRHEAGHLLLGELDLLAAPLGEREVLHAVLDGRGGRPELLPLRGGDGHVVLSWSWVAGSSAFGQRCVGAGARALATTRPGPFAPGSGGEAASVRVAEAGLREQPRELLRREARARLAHPAAERVVGVARGVHARRAGRPARGCGAASRERRARGPAR